jgi:hypothetical protein
MTMKNTNLMQFPSTTRTPAAPVKQSRKAAEAAAAAEEIDLIKIDHLTATIYAISFNPFFKAQGFTMDHLAAAAMSVASQHMAGASEEGLAITAEAYAKE